MPNMYDAQFTSEVWVLNFPLEAFAGCDADTVVTMRDQGAGRDLTREEIADVLQAARDAEEILAEYAEVSHE